MEYLTFALPLALLLTWLGWQIWDERRSRQRRETELRRLAKLNEIKLRDRIIPLPPTEKSMTGSPRQAGPNISGPKPVQSRFARADGVLARLETMGDHSGSSSSPDQPMDGADGSRITAWPNHRGVTLPPTPESPTSSSSAADGSRGVAIHDSPFCQCAECYR